MTKTIYYFATSADSAALHNFAVAVGLTAIPALIEQDEISANQDPAEGPYCYLSPVPRKDLHPYGTPPRVGPATDPLIQFWRAYNSPTDGLIRGCIRCSDDVRELYAITRPYFDKLARWIENEWSELPHAHYIGPDANSLCQGGAKLWQLPPNLNIRQVEVPVKRANATRTTRT